MLVKQGGGELSGEGKGTAASMTMEWGCQIKESSIAQGVTTWTASPLPQEHMKLRHCDQWEWERILGDSHGRLRTV